MWIPDFLVKHIRAKIESDQKATNDLRVISLESELRTVKEANKGLDEKLRRYTNRLPIDITIGDPIPADKEKRRQYVGAVAGLFHDILDPKLRQMIAKVRETLESELNTREQDLQLKATSYALWEIIRWGELMVSEDKAYTAGQDPSRPDDRKTE